ncbi:ribonuclease Z [Dysgonomonas sp. 216]|uniref:ribonuclease Z n=1 Tax=Dysgonomonas sp. 216 TaxID=2302934 RepID=UPI0013D03D78|nr:ribonuclease Z [Dysgonomonas sp. 216]NDW18862.1 ribonuclease Z [Dysgonomonas sp. 216]
MQVFDIHILGCGSALPTAQHYPSSQIVHIREKLFMVDCGEGAQLQMRKSKLSFSKLNSIFISHLHGDHCFGLMGLISTLGLLGRTADLTIYAVAELEDILRPQLDFFCRDMIYKVLIKPFDAEKNAVIYEDRSIKVSTIPLKHRVPCAGFLFEEKEGDRHIIPDMVKYYNVPVKELQYIKRGEDFTTPDGQIIPCNKLTRPADPVRKYAYCSDTAYSEEIIPIIAGVDLLYHEATFGNADKHRAPKTKHTTAEQAALIAKTAGVKELMLGHFSSRYPDNNMLLSEAKAIFSNTILANENLLKKL